MSGFLLLPEEYFFVHKENLLFAHIWQSGKHEAELPVLFNSVINDSTHNFFLWLSPLINH
jgi:hypothetical protein